MACPECENVKINTFITQSNSSSCWAPIEHFQLRKNCSPVPENSVELICRSFLFLLLSPRWVLWSSNFEISNSPPSVQVLYTISSILCWNFHSAVLFFISPAPKNWLCTLQTPPHLWQYPLHVSCLRHFLILSLKLLRWMICSTNSFSSLLSVSPRSAFQPSVCVLASWVRCFTQKSGSSQLILQTVNSRKLSC